MSHQKHHVSGKDLPRNTPHRHRKKNTNYQINFCEYGQCADRSVKKKPVFQDDSSSSNEGKKYERPKRRKHRRSTDKSEINTLKQKLNEIETLREQIEVFHSILSSQEHVHDSDQKPVKWINSSCFSFLSALTCKKSKPEIVEIFGNSSKLNQSREKNPKALKKLKPKRNKELVGNEKEQDLHKQHRITNNNTIVLPESYALSRQQSGDQFLMSNLNKKLEVQVNEIKEIKETLKECIHLLKDSGFAEANRYARPNFPFILEDYIKLNRVLPAKYDTILPNTYIDEGFLSLINHTEKRFDQGKSLAGTNTQPTPIIESYESLTLSRKVSKTTLTSDIENKFPDSINEVYCQKKSKNETVLKVSPFRCSDAGRCHKLPKSVSKSLSTYSVVEVQRKKNKKKHGKPVKFNVDQRGDSNSRKDPAKKSCFVKFIRFLCCKGN